MKRKFKHLRSLICIACQVWVLKRSYRKMNRILRSHGVVVLAPETVTQAWERTFPEPALEVPETEPRPKTADEIWVEEQLAEKAGS